MIEAIQPLPFYRVLNVNALSLNNAGAYISQELGYALAWGNEYMGQLTDAWCDFAKKGVGYGNSNN